MLHFNFAVLLIAAISFTTSCIAARNDQEASSSSGSSSSGKPLHSEPLYTFPQKPTVDTYFSQLSPDRTRQLSPNAPGNININVPDSVPFYERLPIFDLDTPVYVVEQALKDYPSVFLIDSATNTVQQVTYGQGRIQMKPVEARKAETVLLFDSLNPNVHILRKAKLGIQIKTQMPGRVEIDYLPHVGSTPILTPRYDSLGHMLAALNSATGGFWHIREDRRPVLVRPRLQALARVADHAEDIQLTSILTRYGAMTQQYGNALASVKYGAPILLDEDNREARNEHTSLTRYPRFGPKATRDQMVKALQERGRLRFYDQHYPNSRPIKLKVRNPNIIPGIAMDIEIEKLSDREIAEEVLMKRLGKLHLPV